MKKFVYGKLYLLIIGRAAEFPLNISILLTEQQFKEQDLLFRRAGIDFQRSTDCISQWLLGNQGLQ
jgi:hypothetical protein